MVLGFLFHILNGVNLNMYELFQAGFIGDMKSIAREMSHLKPSLSIRLIFGIFYSKDEANQANA